MAESHHSERAGLSLRLEQELHSLERDKTVLGRSRSCDIRLRDDSVSRLHSALFWQGGTLMLEDLGSSNGTYLNGQRVVSAKAVKSGDRLRFGTLRGAIERQQPTRERQPRETSRVASWNVTDRIIGPPATFGWRVLAVLLDLAGVGLTSVVAFLPLLLLLAAEQFDLLPGTRSTAMQARAIAAGVSGALWVIVLLAYVVHGWAQRGGTPGMLMLGLRVLDWRYRFPIGYSRAWLRLVAVLVTVLTLGAGFLVSLFRRDRRALHDVLAGTLVVHRLPVAPSSGSK